MTEVRSAPTVEELWVRIQSLEAEVGRLARRVPEDQVRILVIGGEFERVHTALMLAHAATALELDAAIYFAMWGVQALRVDAPRAGRSAFARCLNAILAPDVERLPSGRLNFGGLGPVAFKRLMQKHAIETPGRLLDLAPEMGIELIACPLSLSLFALEPTDLRPGVQIKGATSFLEEASRARFSTVF